MLTTKRTNQMDFFRVILDMSSATMNALPWVLMLLTVHQTAGSSQPLDFTVSDENVPWSEAMDQCLREGRPVRKGDLKHKDLFDAMPVNVKTWVEARQEKTLVWKGGSGNGIHFFQPTKTCYYTGQIQERWAKNTTAYSPLDCFLKCGEQSGRWQMFLQADRCCCLGEEDCDNFPKCEPDGGHGAHSYDIYKFSRTFKFAGLRAGNEKEQVCFVGTFRSSDKNRMQISKERCNSSHAALCVHDDLSFNTSLNGNVTYDEGNDWCANHSSSLPSKQPPHMWNNKFAKRLKKAFNDSDLNPFSRSFWLDLTMKQEPFWATGERIEGNILIAQDGNPGCIALKKDHEYKLSLHVLSCKIHLPYLCSAVTPDDGLRDKQISYAMAAGITGVVCLFVFCVVAVILYVLKRMGCLNVRNKKPAFNSTGDWDRTDCTNRSRSVKQQNMDELQSQLIEEKRQRVPHLPPNRAPIPIPDTGEGTHQESEHFYHLVEEEPAEQPAESACSLPIPLTCQHSSTGVSQPPAKVAAGHSVSLPLFDSAPETSMEQRKILHQIRDAVEYVLSKMDQPAEELAVVGNSSEHVGIRLRQDEQKDQQGDNAGDEYSTLALTSPLKAVDRDGPNATNTTATDTSTATATTATDTSTATADSYNTDDHQTHSLESMPQEGIDMRHAQIKENETTPREVNTDRGDLGVTADCDFLASTLTNTPAVSITTRLSVDDTSAEAQSHGGKALLDEKTDPEVNKPDQETISEVCAGSEFTNAEMHLTPAVQPTAAGPDSSQSSSLDDTKTPAAGDRDGKVIMGNGKDDEGVSTPGHADSEVMSHNNETTAFDVVVVSLKRKPQTP